MTKDLDIPDAILLKTEMNLSNRLSFWFKLASRYPRVCEVVFVPIVLSIIFGIFLGRFLDGDHSAATWQDNTFLILPIFSFISKSFSSGQFPYWINSIAGGIPLYNTPQFSAIYPFYFLGFDLYVSPLSASIQVHFLTLFHVGILYLNTYIMLRIFQLPVIASILGASLLAFSVNTLQLIPWINIISPYSWFPLALGSVYLILENKRPKLGLLLGAVSFSLLITASPAHALIHLVYCTGFLFLTVLIVRRTDGYKLTASLRGLILLSGISILLSAPALIPSVISAKNMIRWVSASKAVIGHERIPLDCFVANQSQPKELANTFFPLNMKHEVGNSYLGVLPIFLVTFSLFKARRNWLIIPFLILGLYTLFSSTGEHLGLAYLNYRLPLWNKIREPERHLIIFNLTFCALSAFGFHHLTEWVKKSSDLDFKKHLVAFGVFMLAFLSSYYVRQSYKVRMPDSILIGSFLLFLAILLALRLKPRLNGIIFQGALAAIVISPQLWFPDTIPLIKDGDYFTEPNLRSHRILNEISKIDNIRSYRLIIQDDLPSTRWWSMNAVYYGLRTFQAYMNPLPYNQFQEVFFAFNAKNYFKLLGAKYYLCKSCNTIPLSDYQLEREIEGYKLYSTENARPHYFLVNQIAQTYTDSQDFWSKLKENDDYLHKVYIHANDLTKFSAWLGSNSKLEWEVLREAAAQNSLELILRTNARAMLVLNEYFNKDWTVKVNGESQRPIKVNLNQLGILLPKGTSQVHFEYYPSLFVWLLHLRKAVIFVLICYFSVIAFRNRSKVKDWFRKESGLEIPSALP